MWLNWLALGLLAVFVSLGAARGGFRAGMGLLALAVGYAAGVFGAAALAPSVAAATGVPELLAIPLAGSLLFVAGFGGVSLLAWWLRRRGVGEGPFSARERFLGAVFGGIRGALVVLLVSVLAHWLDALRVVGDGAPLPPVADSFTGRVTADVVESGLSAALADSGAAGRVAARMAAQPARSLEDFQAVVDHPLVTGLQEDPLFWTYVEHENVDGALDRPVALRLLNDAPLRARLVGLGLASETAAQDPTVLRSELADVLREVGPRVRGLREDPALQELMQDPEVVAAVQAGNTIALLGHPGFRALVERAASRPVAETSQN